MWGENLSIFKLLIKVVYLYITGQVVKPCDIGCSYSTVSAEYDRRFLEVMHRYNISMLSALTYNEQARVLDLACGTGFNCEWILSQHANTIIDGVDISKGMLEKAHDRLGYSVNLIQSSMLEFLRQCKDNYYDIIVCSWALKYETPSEILKECRRVLKENGQIGIIVNSKHTLPEVRKVYTKLLAQNVSKVNKLMMELPNPRDEKHLYALMCKAGFTQTRTYRDFHKFMFSSASEAADWVTSTGALAGFDIMIDLHDPEVKSKLALLFEKYDISEITHHFIWGVARKC